MTASTARWAPLAVRAVQSVVFGASMFAGLWLVIAAFALVRILRPEAAGWLTVSGSLYTLGGIALVVGAATPCTLAPRQRRLTLALAVFGVWMVITAVQFFAFISRPNASVLLFLWNFVRWGAALGAASYLAAMASVELTDRAKGALGA